MKKKKWLFIAFITLLVVMGIVLFNNYNLDNSTKNSTDNQSLNQTTTQKVYNHTSPIRISKNDYFKGEFISNDIASVYPRRDAIVKDILVDIGDTVKVGDTLAVLLNPGVDGEGQSKINLKDTIVSTKKELLEDLLSVKDAKVAEIDQKIQENQSILQATINNYDSKITQIGDNETSGSEYQVTLKSLENLEKNLENAQSTKTQLLTESNNNIIQKQELLDSKIDDVYNKIIPIFYIGNEDDLNYTKINVADFSDEFGAKDITLRKELIDEFLYYYQNYNTLELENKYKLLLKINKLLIKTLQSTIVSTTVTDTLIDGYISKINTYNTSLISQKEVLDDALQDYNILEITQKEKIDNIELQIYQKQNELSLLGSKSNSTQSEKELAVAKINADIETLKKSRELLITSQDKEITALENEIKVAQADLESQYVQSGDYKITSPFSGVISKRGIDVGEKISPSIEAFRISGVDTTLSRITKKEVKFYVPENLKDNIEIGNEIYFSLGDDDSNSFTGSVYRVSPEIDSETLSIIVQAKVNDNIVLPNKSTIRVQLETKEDIYKIPSSTIYNKDERKIVYYKKDNGKLGIRDVNIISDDGEYSLVTGDFDETLKVVTTPIFIN